MELQTDCPKCSMRHGWDTTNDDRRCPRCILMASDNIPGILFELRKTKIPGQEPLLHLIETLDRKLKEVESGLKTSRGREKTVGASSEIN